MTPALALYGDLLGQGAVVGDHVIEARVGRGGCGAVYRARSIKSGATVAIKVLHRELAADPRMVARFAREARAVKAIAHPGVVDIHDIGTLHDGRPYYAMEWLDGRDLAHELSARGGMTAAEIREIAEQIGGALGAVHAAGVVHRDVKPANIVAVGSPDRRRFVLVDFGIARWIDPEPGQTVTAASVVGTPESMAPEQIRGERVDARTDVYGFGVLLFQLATGRPPFCGADATEVEDQHLNAPPPRASDLAAVPPAIDPVIARCLAKRPEDRPASIAGVLVELRAALAGPSAERIRCVGLHVAAATDDADRADQLLERALCQLRGAGLTVAADTGNSVIAVVRGDGPGERERAAAAAHRIAGPGITVRIHAADAIIDRGRFRGGPLFCLADWPGQG